MSRNRINIRVFGLPRSGKTTIASAILDALDKAGFSDITFIDDGDPIYDEEQKKRVDALKERIGVSISTHNVSGLASIKEAAICQSENVPAE